MSFLVLQSCWRGRESWLFLLLLSFGYLVTVYVLWLFLAVPWISLQFVIVVFPDHTHLLFLMDWIKVWSRKRLIYDTVRKRLRTHTATWQQEHNCRKATSSLSLSLSHESIQSIATPDPGHHLRKWQNRRKTSHTRECSVVGDHKAARNSQFWFQFFFYCALHFLQTLIMKR